MSEDNKTVLDIALEEASQKYHEIKKKRDDEIKIVKAKYHDKQNGSIETLQRINKQKVDNFAAELKKGVIVLEAQKKAEVLDVENKYFDELKEAYEYKKKLEEQKVDKYAQYTRAELIETIKKLEGKNND